MAFPASQYIPGNKYQLTIKEIQVMVYVARGANSRAIGNQMGIKKRTVHYHFETIKKKFKVCTMEEVMYFASLGDLLKDYLRLFDTHLIRSTVSVETLRINQKRIKDEDILNSSKCGVHSLYGLK
jgi:hypothetical protein